MLLQVIQKIAYPWCQAFLLLREPLSSHCTVRVEMVMQQSYFRCGYNIHSLLLSHAISSSLRKKILLMKKTLHIIVRCFESDWSSMVYMREEITVIKSVQSLPSDSSGNCPSPVPQGLTHTDLREHCTHQLHTLNIVISDCTGCTFGLILLKKSLFTKQNYCAAARNLFSPKTHCTATV